ncbi:MAG: 4-hydroxy-tetrahydrodipicolinate reductase [Candidatus Omnitrophica bacterium]|nr:4-hydroxy-tetrahydrodipicolinate reductase [Candidatus Omnitrophota bacterium]
MSIKLAISGCHGRVGQAICDSAKKDPRFHIKTLFEIATHPKIKESVCGVMPSADNNALKGCDVLIEFTSPEATMQNLEVCLKYGVRMVIGTTGLNEEQVKKIESASKKIPIVFSSNMSIGVNVLFKMIELASKMLVGIDDIKITETHHIHKKDAPSGTAKTMLQIAEKFSNLKVKPVESIREGEVVGYHKITFETPEDTLTLIHNAKNRGMFAKGGLAAAKFVMDKKNGLFTMKQVLGLE